MQTPSLLLVVSATPRRVAVDDEVADPREKKSNGLGLGGGCVCGEEVESVGDGDGDGDGVLGGGRRSQLPVPAGAEVLRDKLLVVTAAAAAVGCLGRAMGLWSRHGGGARCRRVSVKDAPENGAVVAAVGVVEQVDRVGVLFAARLVPAVGQAAGVGEMRLAAFVAPLVAAGTWVG